MSDVMTAASSVPRPAPRSSRKLAPSSPRVPAPKFDGETESSAMQAQSGKQWPALGLGLNEHRTLQFQLEDKDSINRQLTHTIASLKESLRRENLECQSKIVAAEAKARILMERAENAEQQLKWKADEVRVSEARRDEVWKQLGELQRKHADTVRRHREEVEQMERKFSHLYQERRAQWERDAKTKWDEERAELKKIVEGRLGEVIAEYRTQIEKLQHERDKIISGPTANDRSPRLQASDTEAQHQAEISGLHQRIIELQDLLVAARSESFTVPTMGTTSTYQLTPPSYPWREHLPDKQQSRLLSPGPTSREPSSERCTSQSQSPKVVTTSALTGLTTDSPYKTYAAAMSAVALIEGGRASPQRGEDKVLTGSVRRSTGSAFLLQAPL